MILLDEILAVVVDAVAGDLAVVVDIVGWDLAVVAVVVYPGQISQKMLRVI